MHTSAHSPAPAFPSAHTCSRPSFSRRAPSLHLHLTSSRIDGWPSRDSVYSDPPLFPLLCSERIYTASCPDSFEAPSSPLYGEGDLTPLCGSGSISGKQRKGWAQRAREQGPEPGEPRLGISSSQPSPSAAQTLGIKPLASQASKMYS